MNSQEIKIKSCYIYTICTLFFSLNKSKATKIVLYFNTPYRNLCLGKKSYSLQVTTDSDTVFREESIVEGFKIVTVQ